MPLPPFPHSFFTPPFPYHHNFYNIMFHLWISTESKTMCLQKAVPNNATILLDVVQINLGWECWRRWLEQKSWWRKRFLSWRYDLKVTTLGLISKMFFNTHFHNKKTYCLIKLCFVLKYDNRAKYKLVAVYLWMAVCFLNPHTEHDDVLSFQNWQTKFTEKHRFVTIKYISIHFVKKTRF